MTSNLLSPDCYSHSRGRSQSSSQYGSATEEEIPSEPPSPSSSLGGNTFLADFEVGTTVFDDLEEDATQENATFSDIFDNQIRNLRVTVSAVDSTGGPRRQSEVSCAGSTAKEPDTELENLRNQMRQYTVTAAPLTDQEWLAGCEHIVDEFKVGFLARRPTEVWEVVYETTTTGQDVLPDDASGVTSVVTAGALPSSV